MSASIPAHLCTVARWIHIASTVHEASPQCINPYNNAVYFLSFDFFAPLVLAVPRIVFPRFLRCFPIFLDAHVSNGILRVLPREKHDSSRFRSQALTAINLQSISGKEAPNQALSGMCSTPLHREVKAGEEGRGKRRKRTHVAVDSPSRAWWRVRYARAGSAAQTS